VGPGVAKIVQDPACRNAVEILAAPTHRFGHRTGGGMTPASRFDVCSRTAGGDGTIVVATPSFEGALLVHVFDTREEYLRWWLELLATPVEEPAANYLPPPLALESLVYVLHAIDAFRRASYRSMLDYAPAERAVIRPAEFTDSMTASIRARDIRWLLPAFVHLTPDLDLRKFEPRAEHLETLAERDFLLAGKDPKSGEPVFVFGEAGTAMGVEFHRTWVKSVGFDARVLSADGERVIQRAFLAPTAIANHLFVLEPADEGSWNVNHQAYTVAQLAAKYVERLDAALRVPAVVESPAPVRAGPAAVFCHHCGAKLKPGSKFCGACGTRV
jgi:hypothetical protein